MCFKLSPQKTIIRHRRLICTNCSTMPKYNIIYTSPDSTIYRWNGAGFDKLEDEEREVLLYSGKSVNAEEVDEALSDCRARVKEEFPDDSNPDIKRVEVAVS